MELGQIGEWAHIADFVAFGVEPLQVLQPSGGLERGDLVVVDFEVPDRRVDRQWTDVGDAVGAQDNAKKAHLLADAFDAGDLVVG